MAASAAASAATAACIGNEPRTIKALTSGQGEPANDDQVAHLFRRCLTRPPTSDERAALLKYYEAQLARLKTKELDASKIAGPGDGDANERAAWTLAARAILNLDEAITKE